MFWSHRGELCTFDMMVEEFGLATEPLASAGARSCAAPTRRGSTSRREAAGLLAASLGLSRMYADDLEQLEAGMALYDAFYRWCRDATDETHNWPTATGGGRARRGAIAPAEPAPGYPTFAEAIAGLGAHRRR